MRIPSRGETTSFATTDEDPPSWVSGVFARVVADDGDRVLAGAQRQHRFGVLAEAVLQQHGALIGDFARQFAVRGRAGFGLGDRFAVFEQPEADVGDEHFFHPFVERGFHHLPFGHRGFELGVFVAPREDRGRRRHAGVEGFGDVTHRKRRVRPHEAFEAPRLQQFQRVRVLARGRAVDAVVGAHHRGGPALLDRRLEGGVFDFLQPAFGDDVVGARLDQRDAQASGLLVVAREVLDLGDHSLALDPPHLGGGDGAHQVRVLAEALCRPAPERAALDVHRRSRDQGLALRPRLFAEGFAVAFGEARIEGGTEVDGGRERGHSGGPVADPVRAIGEALGGNIQMRVAARPQSTAAGGDDLELFGDAHLRGERVGAFTGGLSERGAGRREAGGEGRGRRQEEPGAGSGERSRQTPTTRRDIRLS